MSVYFIQCGLTGAVKIGLSSSPWRRMDKMQSDTPGDLVMLALIPGGLEVETDLHQRFARHRIRGEWFAVSDDLQVMLDGLERPVRPRRTLKIQTSPTLLAARVGIGKGYASDILSGKKAPGGDLALRIYDATGLRLGILSRVNDAEIAQVRRLFTSEAA